MNTDITVPSLVDLPQEAIAEAKRNRERMYSFLLDLKQHFDNGFVLLSRKAPGYAWESVGFYSDTAKQRLFAKVGNSPAQPIAMDDGTHLIMSDICRLLWKREFKYASNFVDVKTPFTVEEIVEKAAEQMADEETLKRLDGYHALLEKNWGSLNAVIGRCNAAKAALDALTADGKVATAEEATQLANELAEAQTLKAEYEAELVNDLKMASIQIPMFDDYLRRLIEANPELCADLSGIPDVEHFVRAQLTWMKIQVDDLKAKVSLSKNVVVSHSLPETKLRAAQQVEKLLAVADDPAAEDSIRNLLSVLQHVSPELRTLISSSKETTVKAKLLEVQKALKA